MNAVPILSVLPELDPVCAVDVSGEGAAGWRYWEAAVASGACLVSGFDPDPSAILAARSEATPGIAFHPVAVADGSGLTLHLTRDARFRSALPPDTTFAAAFEGLAGALAVEATRALETRPLADALSAAGGGCDLLRVHLPGAEARVLQGAAPQLAGIAVVHVRVPLVPLYREEPPFESIDALLAAHGFLMHRFVPGVSVPLWTPPVTERDARMPGPGQPLWREAIYVADYVDPGSRPARVWHRLAVAAHALYAAPDLAHRALANADALERTDLAIRYADAILGAPVRPSAAPTQPGWLARLLGR